MLEVFVDAITNLEEDGGAVGVGIIDNALPPQIEQAVLVAVVGRGAERGREQQQDVVLVG